MYARNVSSRVHTGHWVPGRSIFGRTTAQRTIAALESAPSHINRLYGPHVSPSYVCGRERTPRSGKAIYPIACSNIFLRSAIHRAHEWTEDSPKRRRDSVNCGTDISANPPTFLVGPGEPPMIFGMCPGRSKVGTGPGPVLPKSDARLTSSVYRTCACNTWSLTLLNGSILTEGSKEMRRVCSGQLSQM